MLSPLRNTYYATWSPLCENVTSSAKPETHKISQRRRNRTEQWPQATCVKNFVKFGRVVSEIMGADVLVTVL